MHRSDPPERQKALMLTRNMNINSLAASSAVSAAAAAASFPGRSRSSSVLFSVPCRRHSSPPTRSLSSERSRCSAREDRCSRRHIECAWAGVLRLPHIFVFIFNSLFCAASRPGRGGRTSELSARIERRNSVRRYCFAKTFTHSAFDINTDADLALFSERSSSPRRQRQLRPNTKSANNQVRSKFSEFLVQVSSPRVCENGVADRGE